MAILGGCLCFDLPTGCRIIGVLYLVFAIIDFIGLALINLGLWVFHFVLDMVKEALKTQKEFGGLSVKLDEDFVPTDEDLVVTTDDGKTISINEQMIDENIFIIKIVFLVFLVVCFLSIITSSMLLSAVKTARRGMLLPWLVQEALHIVIGIGCCVLLLWKLQAAWVWCVPFLVMVVLSVFFMLVVASQYQALGMLRMHDDEMRMK